MSHQFDFNEGLVQFAPCVALACLVGLVRFFSERKGDKKASLFDMFGDVLMSGFAGVIILFSCQEFELSPEMTGALVGWCAHESTRFMFLLKKKLKSSTNA